MPRGGDAHRLPFFDDYSDVVASPLPPREGGVVIVLKPGAGRGELGRR